MKFMSWYRIITILAMSISMFLKVVWFKKRHAKHWNEAEWRELLRSQAAVYRKKALELEGLLIKLGQFLSTRADILPKEFIDELSDLIDRVPPEKWEDCLEIIESEWQEDIYTYLESIDTDPVAAASIGQVYKAVLIDGRQAAVKVRRPGIEKIIRADFKALRMVMALADRFTKIGDSTDMKRLYKEIEDVIGDELNFYKEYKNAMSFSERYKDSEQFFIPAYEKALCTEKVLVMEWIDGVKVTDTAFIEEQGLPKNELALRLLTGFLEQALKAGKFHADPHPGNIFLNKDGTFWLIDFGMAGTITPAQAGSLRKIVAGFVFDRYEDSIDAMGELGFLLEHADKDRLKEKFEELMVRYFQEDMSQWDERKVEAYLEDIQDLMEKEPIQMPSEFAFLGRAVSTLIGVLYIIDPDLDLIEASKPPVMDWIIANQEETGGAGWQSIAKDYARPLLSVPSDVQAYLRAPDKKRISEERQRQFTFEYSVHLQNRLFLFISFWLLAAGGVILAYLTFWLPAAAAFTASLCSLIWIWRAGTAFRYRTRQWNR
ncbi:putative unusual protein kinase regulating ubiquinone biosynthesis (AarF/ABC1/UbiB family) [Sinobaca qinghaiensis]|uniref:Putative unusual protein kinase regulating ubiquinone biosynthesis (AarF/ABC1/UbiB family) n=2 Tax=Sinobaca qinghaiensis TaxID=342944 RepID=A0A419UXA0_9BACL|nr:putative unusual protein kinase regulating ubiquinone biosynthesis (AarF/ABC1/UbiB family) [Sinobaca qinghaiensis]